MTMRFKLTLILLFFASSLLAKKNHYPVIKTAGDRIEDFVPAGWMLFDSVAGDLNSDNIPDVVVILQSKDKIQEFLYDGETNKWEDPLYGHARILLILFKTTNGYTKALQNNDFILREMEGMSGDPLKKPGIKNGELTLSFYSGGDFRLGANYVFRFQNNDWFLIRADMQFVYVLSHSFINRSYDFSAKKVKYEEGEIGKADPTKTEWKPIVMKQLKTFKTFIRPYTWKIENDLYL